jgi:NTP pyrophosphatase (non-canonical NTP hydrolase)
MKLTFQQLRIVNTNRCEQVFHSIDSWSIADWAVALAGEAGETCDAVKKLRRLQDGKNTSKDPQTVSQCIENIGNELADTIIYADLLAAKLGIDLEKAIVRKFNIVSERMNSNIKLQDEVINEG